MTAKAEAQYSPWPVLHADATTRVASAIGRQKEAGSGGSAAHASGYHNWRSEEEVDWLRDSLLRWYDASYRKMPWRVHDTKETTDKSPEQRAYEVWVSEIMLQQTQVATVIPYWTRWMARWPTVQALAAAGAEEINELWSGLGYYSRASRLHAAAKLLVGEHAGTLPRDPEALKKTVPGIGPYTAGAIASIAYNVKAELVDGNVTRVFSRIRAIGGDPKSKACDSLVWKLAREAVPDDRPGAFNQALMDLGATICTPQNPNCEACPLRECCLAYAEKKAADTLASTSFFKDSKSSGAQGTAGGSEDIEDTCGICGTDSPTGDFSVTRYPLKVAKKKQREERRLVCVAEATGETADSSRFLVLKRPTSGLLPGLWQFPMSEALADPQPDGTVDENGESTSDACTQVRQLLKPHVTGEVDSFKISYRGDVKHVFSHIIWQMEVYSCPFPATDDLANGTDARWLTKEEIADAALPTGMRKAFDLCFSKPSAKRKAKDAKAESSAAGASKKSRKSPATAASAGKSQRGIASFFAAPTTREDT
ncbi:A/G-specific adenine DNA glycosylase-like protein [Hyaloraphidium curvatum]|nr:A/G-specific adenine DNA glycosylase-like protein [Hyaloraphidium curvatum]